MTDKSIKNLWGMIATKATAPAVANISEHSRGGINKAYIPKFLYKPPFGYPRFVDLPNVRRMASMPYVEMCISTIVDEASSIPWDIVPIEGKETAQTEKHIEEVKAFFMNPNTNKEGWEEIRRKYIRDILEIDAGVLNKTFNKAGKMVEIVARDGATFTKNPDIYGMFTDRVDLLLEDEIAPKMASVIELGQISYQDAREEAAYFQYGWISGARPVPFGRREIVWMERNPRTDNIYGRSPVEILMETIQTLIYAIEHNLEYFNDNSIPKGIIGLDGGDAAEVEAFKEQWMQQQLKKDSAGNWKKKFHDVPVVGKIPKFERIQFSNAELELLEGQKWWAKLVWACFGVTSVELGYTEDSKGLANQIVQSNVFKKRSINPILRLEEYRINQEIISEFGFDDIEYKYMLFDVDEEMKKAQLYKEQLASGWRSINEIRVDEGLDEVEWGDKESEAERFDRENAMYGEEAFGSVEQEVANESKKPEKEKPKNNKKEEVKAKYIRRTGSSGSYKYWYRDPKTGKLAAGKKPDDKLKINSAYGDAVYQNEERAIGSFAHIVKPINYTLLEKNGKFLVTTNKRAGQFKKDGWEEIGHGMPKGKGIRATEVPFRDTRASQAKQKKKEQAWREDAEDYNLIGKEVDKYVDARKEGSTHAQAVKIAEPKTKSMTTSGPLVLKPGEVMTGPKMKQSIIYLLEENEKDILALIKKESAESKITEVKSVGEIIKKLKGFMSAIGLKFLSDKMIEDTYMKGWDSAETQMQANFLPNKDAIAFIQDYTFNNIKGMTEEIGDDLRQELERGIMAGEGVEKLKDRVSSVFNVGKVRAEAIARTETTRAENHGRLQAFKASGDNWSKKWVTHEDDRTSKICKSLDGQVVKLDENFKDASGWEGPVPPSHVNCRSSVVFFDAAELKRKELKRKEIELMEKEMKDNQLMNEEIDLKLKEKEAKIKEQKSKLLKRLTEDTNEGNKDLSRPEAAE